MKNYRVVWSNLITMYLVQAVVCLLFMNLFDWQSGNASIVSGVLVGCCFGLCNVNIIVKKK